MQSIIITILLTWTAIGLIVAFTALQLNKIKLTWKTYVAMGPIVSSTVLALFLAYGVITRIVDWALEEELK